MTRSLRSTVIAAIAGAAALLAARAAAQDVPPILWPEYEVTVSDGARLKKLFKENAWMKEFQASNLFRGSMVRLGPVLYAAGTNDSWKGRLVDFLAERFLDGRPVRLSYFRAPELVSPFGVTLPGLSPREHEALKLVVKVLRSGEDVTTKVTLDENRVEDVAVTPLALRLQRFAAVETPECLAISRDPRVAAVLSRRCAREPRLAAAVVDVDTHAFFSAWSAVLYRLFGIDDRLRLTFDWDQKRARFTPAGAELTLAKDHLLGTGPVDPALLGAIPADTLFFATVFVPDPGALSVASVETYFRTARERRGARAVPVSLLYFGMTTGEKDRAQALSALLVPQPKGDDRALSDLDALFNQSASYKVLVSRACPGYVALSPSKAALQRIEEVCAGRRAVLPEDVAEAPPGVHAAAGVVGRVLERGRVPEVRRGVGLAARHAGSGNQVERRGADRPPGRHASAEGARRRHAASRPPPDVRLRRARDGRRGRDDRSRAVRTAMSPVSRRLLVLLACLQAAPLLAKELYITVRRDFGPAEAPEVELHYSREAPVHGAHLPPEGHEGVRDEPDRPEARLARARGGVEQREVPLLGPQQDAPRPRVAALGRELPAAQGPQGRVRRRLGSERPARASPRARRRSWRARRISRSSRSSRSSPRAPTSARRSTCPDSTGGSRARAACARKWCRLPTVGPGFYLVQVLQGDLEGQVVLVVNDLAASVQQTDGAALVRVARRDGRPAPGADVEVRNLRGQWVAAGRTDPDGVLSIRDLKDTELLVVVREKDSTAIVDTEFFPTTAVFPDVYLYTDRPLYKNGATVRFKGVLRQPVDGLSRLWNSLTGRTEVARVSIVDLTGGVVVKEMDAPLTAFGTFSGALPIRRAGDLNGVYRVRAHGRGREPRGRVPRPRIRQAALLLQGEDGPGDPPRRRNADGVRGRGTLRGRRARGREGLGAALPRAGRDAAVGRGRGSRRNRQRDDVRLGREGRARARCRCRIPSRTSTTWSSTRRGRRPSS